MRLLAAVVLAGCSFQPHAAPGSGDAPAHADAPLGDDAPPIVDGRPDAPPDAPPDAFVYLDARAHPADWWNPAWGSRMKLTIMNGSATAMAQGYQVGLAFDLDAAPCAGNRDQVRIVYNQTEIPRVIDEVGTTEWTWFPLQAAIAASTTNTSYWLYCNNPNPNAAPKDPAMVFDVWDDFNGAALASTWASQGNVSVSNGSVTISANNSGIHSTATYGAQTAVDVMATASGAQVTAPLWWLGYETNFNSAAPWIVWYASSPNAIHPSVNETGAEHDDPTVALDGNPHLYGVETYGSSGAFRRADVIVQSHTYTSPIGPLNLRLHVYQGSGSVSFDWVRVRKAVSPAPTVTVGSVETY